MVQLTISKASNVFVLHKRVQALIYCRQGSEVWFNQHSITPVMHLYLTKEAKPSVTADRAAHHGSANKYFSSKLLRQGGSHYG